jgi:hypothetical protein
VVLAAFVIYYYISDSGSLELPWTGLEVEAILASFLLKLIPPKYPDTQLLQEIMSSSSSAPLIAPRTPGAESTTRQGTPYTDPKPGSKPPTIANALKPVEESVSIATLILFDKIQDWLSDTLNTLPPNLMIEITIWKESVNNKARKLRHVWKLSKAN